MEETALNSATRQQVPSQFCSWRTRRQEGQSWRVSLALTSIFKESAHEGELLGIQSRHCFVLFRCHWCAPCESAGNLRSPGEIKCVLSVLTWWSALGQWVPRSPPRCFHGPPRRCKTLNPETLSDCKTKTPEACPQPSGWHSLSFIGPPNQKLGSKAGKGKRKDSRCFQREGRGIQPGREPHQHSGHGPGAGAGAGSVTVLGSRYSYAGTGLRVLCVSPSFA